MPFNKWKAEFLISSILLAGVIFFTDLITAPEAAVSLLYVALVLVTLFHPDKIITLGMTIGVSVLSLTGMVFIPVEALNHNVILNQCISIIGIWAAFFFILRFKNREHGEHQYRNRLDALFTYATEGMLITNAQGEIIMVNPMASHQLGYEQGELIGKKIETLIPDRMAERHVKHREKYHSSPRPRPMGQGMQLSARRKDGSEFPVEISLSNFTTEEGKFVIAFIIDITERRKSEEQIRKEKELAQRYLDIAPIIFLVLDTEGNIMLINQNGCQIVGLPEQQIVGKNWFDEAIPENIREQLRGDFGNMMAGKMDMPPNFENEIQTATGERRLIAWKNTFIRDEKGRPIAVLSSGEDITERKRQEQLISAMNSELEKRVRDRTEELAETVHKLEDANRVLAVEIQERQAAEERVRASREELRQALSKEKELSELKSRFVTMASHEFRTPLSTILSSASLAGKYNEPSQEEKRTKHLDRIKSAVNNLTSILNDFLSLGKLEEGKVQCHPSEFDIVSFAQDLTGEMKEVTKKGQVISYKHHGEHTKVVLDKNLTRNICINLLSNAIKYSDEGKSIHFATETKDTGLVIRVTDEGIGIPESEQPHIFERFFRANNATNIQGTGLGLNIVKKYAELMDGTIRFESTPQQGTVFIVTLPYLTAETGQ